MRALAVAVLAAVALPLPAAEPDIAITAYVTARELVFEQVGNATVTFRAPDRNITVWETDRTNLPDEVQPKVIYRDIGIRLTITSTLEDIEKIVDEALGITTPPAETPEPAPATPPRRPRRNER